MRHELWQPHPMRCVLFDWEGTLVDFQWDLDGAVRDAQAALRDLGFDLLGWGNHYTALRNRAVLLSPTYGLDQRQVVRCVDAVYDRYDLDAAARWSLQSDATGLLSWLKREGRFRLGLVTNIGRQAVEQGRARLGLDDTFDIVITRNDVELLKPSGEGIERAMVELQAGRGETLFVGDSVSDVVAAQAAGVRVAVVQGGESARAALLAAGPDYLWQSLGQFRTWYAGGEDT